MRHVIDLDKVEALINIPTIALFYINLCYIVEAIFEGKSDAQFE